MCALFTIEAFYPKDDYGNSARSITFSVVSFFSSFFASSFGMTKFFVSGPLPLLPQNAPLAGVLSMKFAILFLLNTMFVMRTFCIEASFFSEYFGTCESRIYALIPQEYRLHVYFLPGTIPFVVNLIRLLLTAKHTNLKYFLKYPQFILCPIFCPLMFEGNSEENRKTKEPIRVWKFGSILNSISLGCIPQLLLLTLDHYKRVPYWNFNGDSNHDTNALLKYPYGNTIFSVTTFILYLCLTIIFFVRDKWLIKNLKSIQYTISAAEGKQGSKTKEINDQV